MTRSSEIIVVGTALQSRAQNATIQTISSQPNLEGLVLASDSDRRLSEDKPTDEGGAAVDPVFRLEIPLEQASKALTFVESGTVEMAVRSDVGSVLTVHIQHMSEHKDGFQFSGTAMANQFQWRMTCGMDDMCQVESVHTGASSLLQAGLSQRAERRLWGASGIFMDSPNMDCSMAGKHGWSVVEKHSDGCWYEKNWQGTEYWQATCDDSHIAGRGRISCS
jgi:hypothetical protein